MAPALDPRRRFGDVDVADGVQQLDTKRLELEILGFLSHLLLEQLRFRIVLVTRVLRLDERSDAVDELTREF